MRYLFLFLGIFFLGIRGLPIPRGSSSKKVTLIRIDGTISPVTSDYVQRGIKIARESGSTALIIELDTPGGLLKSTKKIVQDLLGSTDLPIIVYISPQGASAASAGTFITMAANIAVMAPATNIGAASPVQMGVGGSVQRDTVMQKKIFNYSESYIQSIAQRRGRNTKWAVAAVRDGKSITAQKAVKLNVVDLIALNRKDLLKKIDGRKVGDTILKTKNAKIEVLGLNGAEKWMRVLIRPEIILILIVITIFGIIGETTHPGTLIPGIVGAISLILLLFASSIIPINAAGFLLIGLAVALFVAEAFITSYGILSVGGALSFILGGFMLFQNLPESMSISWAWLIPTTLIVVLFFIWVAFEGIRFQFKGGVLTGKDALIGKTAKVIEDVNKEGGRVFVLGEYWNAVSDEDLVKGEKCQILAVEKLTLKVKLDPTPEIKSNLDLDLSDQNKNFS